MFIYSLLAIPYWLFLIVPVALGPGLALAILAAFILRTTTISTENTSNMHQHILHISINFQGGCRVISVAAETIRKGENGSWHIFHTQLPSPHVGIHHDLQ